MTVVQPKTKKQETTNQKKKLPSMSAAAPAKSKATPPTISYRGPQARDLEQLAYIYNYAVRETAASFDTQEKDPGHFGEFVMGDHLHRMLVAEVEGHVVGYAGTYPFSQRHAYAQLAEVMVYVHPEWQQRGVGKALLREIHRGDFLDGLFTVLALINKENVYVHRAFAALGYAYKGEMTDVALKFGRRHSLVIYQLRLAQ